jgi:hypothetical protein
MIRRDPGANQSVRSGQCVKQVDFDTRSDQPVSGIEAGRPGVEDGCAG